MKKTFKFDWFLVSVILIVVIILVGLGGLFYYKLSNSMTVFSALIDNVFNYLEESADSFNGKSLSGSVALEVEGKNTSLSDYSWLGIEDKRKIFLSYGIDYQDKLISVDMKSSCDKDKVFLFDAYLEGGNGYFGLGDLYDKKIMVPISWYDNLFKNRRSSYKSILEELRLSLINSLREEYFSKDYVTISEKKILKTTLNLDSDNYMVMKSDVINYLLNDSKFLKGVADFFDIKEGKVRKYLEGELKRREDVDIDIILYTKNGKFVQLELVRDSYQVLFKKEGESKYSYLVDKLGNVLYNGDISIVRDNNDTSIDIKYNDIEKDVGLRFKINSSYEVGKVISKKEIGEAVNYSDISDDELRGIYSKIIEVIGVDYLDID